MSSNPEGTRVSAVVATVVSGLILLSLGAGAGAVVRTETLAVRVARLEEERSDGRALVVVIAKLEAKLDGLTQEVSQLREDLRTARRPALQK